MHSKFFLTVIFLIINLVGLQAQTIIPDTNLRNTILKSNPALFNKKKELIDSLALKFNGSIDCSGKNIINITGLEKFTSLTSFNCSNNRITNIDLVKNLTKLTFFDCYNNLITTVPDLSKLVKLNYFKCAGNKITKLPNLGNNVALVTLDCFDNFITRIPGLEKLNSLMFLNAYNNSIDSLPDLSKLTNLTLFQCYNNKIPRIPGLGNMSNLTSLLAGNNPIVELPELTKLEKMEKLMFWDCNLKVFPSVSTMEDLTLLDLNGNNLKKLPDLSKNINLTELRFQGNKVDSIVGLKRLVALQRLDAGNNNLVNIDDIVNAKSSLFDLIINDNKINTLPNFSDFKVLSNIQVQGNYLTFKNLSSIAILSSINNFVYSPQASILMPESFIQKEHYPFLVGLPIHYKMDGNNYTWYKNDSIVLIGPMDSLYISEISMIDSGNYHVSITNPILPKLILYSNITKLVVKECIDVTNFHYTSLDMNCEKGGSLFIDEESILGGFQPYSYVLTSDVLGKVILSDNNKFIGLNENQYNLKINDMKGCEASVEIEIKGKSTADCKNKVIVGGVSQGADLILEEQGIAKVFDKSGQMVHSFKTPGSWDGTLANGSLIPGQYFVEHNEEHFNITIIK